MIQGCIAVENVPFQIPQTPIGAQAPGETP
jgi:hypothetical protein